MWFFERKNNSSGFSSFSTAEEVTHGIDASNLTAIVTGASSGLGAETTRVLALRGVHVIMAVRNIDAGRQVRTNILHQLPTAKLDIMKLDLSSMESVKNFASKYKSYNLPLNILINNAGVLVPSSILSQDNIEIHFAINHLGHFLLTHLLLEIMKSTALKSGKEGRIVNISSVAHRFTLPFQNFNDPVLRCFRYFAYIRSKLANILHANELAKRFKDDGVHITANSVHPGIIYTNIFRDSHWFDGVFRKLSNYVLKNVSQGAATTCYVALHPQVKGVSGEYFSNCNLAKPSSKAQDATLAQRLWDLSIKLINM